MSASKETIELLAGVRNDFASVELNTKGVEAEAGQQLPKTVDELTDTVTRTYDLSANAAADINIPVVGSVGGGFGRRVVLLERSSFAPVEKEDGTYRYGYAIRLAITVNKLTAEMQLSLPFLAASAEVGQIEGKWMLQVIGLAGEKIDSAILPPKELSVETFVLASQSLENLIKAVRDQTTTFTARLIGVQRPAAIVKRRYRQSVGRAYAIGSVERGWTLDKAMRELSAPSDVQKDAIADTYREFAGIANPSESPTEEVRKIARDVLEDVKTGPR